MEKGILSELLDNFLRKESFIENILSNYKKILTGNKVKKIDDDAIVYVCSDLHGDLETYKKALNIFLETLFEENGNAYWIKTGDLIHGLEGYEDKSKEIIETEICLKEILGDRSLYLLGDHELAQIRNKPIFKYEKNQTDEFKKGLSEEDSKKTIKFLNSLPIIVKAKEYIFSHSGPLKENSRLEEIDSLNYLNTDQKLEEVIKSLTWGENYYEEIEKNNKKLKIRTNLYDEGLMTNFLKKFGAKISIQGHSGISKIKLAYKNGVYEIINGIQDYLARPNIGLLIISTGENYDDSKNMLMIDLKNKFDLDLVDLKKYKIGSDYLQCKKIFIGEETKQKDENKEDENLFEKKQSNENNIENLIRKVMINEKIDEEDSVIEYLRISKNIDDLKRKIKELHENNILKNSY